jgi:ankyrin repeat protein
MTTLVRRGFDNIGAFHPDTKTTALHLAAAQAREDCVCAIFELARGVGGAVAHHAGHRDTYAHTICDQVDDRGRNALHYAATVSDFRASLDQIDRTVRRLVAYGVSPWACDYDQVTPLGFARDLGNSNAAEAIAAVVSAAGA